MIFSLTAYRPRLIDRETSDRASFPLEEAGCVNENVSLFRLLKIDSPPAAHAHGPRAPGWGDVNETVPAVPMPPAPSRTREWEGKDGAQTTVFVLTPTDSLLIFHADPQRACETPARRGSKHGEYRPSDLAIHKTSDLARVGHDMTTSEYRALCPAPGRPIPTTSRAASTRSHPLIRTTLEADG